MKRLMTCLEIIGLKADLQTTVHALRRLGCMHIEDQADLAVRPLMPTPENVHTQEAMQHLLTQIEGLLALLSTGQRATSTIENVNPEARDDWNTEAQAGVNDLAPRVQALISRRDKLQADQDSLPRYETTLRKLLPIIPTSAHDPANMSISILVNRAHEDLLDILSKHVFDLTGGRAEVVIGDVDSAMRAMLVVFPREFSGEVEAVLSQEDISRLRLPSEVGEGSPDAALAAIHRLQVTIPGQLQAIDQELAELTKHWYQKLARWRDLLRDTLDEYSVLSHLGETDATFVIVGWVPAEFTEKVRSALKAAMGERVLVEVLPLTPERKRRAPVVLQNPPLTRPFERLVSLLALPSYDGIDPTRLMALFLPIFFGLMLGDVGYGALLLVISLALRSRFKAGFMRDFMVVLAMGSAWGIVFGFLFGEVLGTLGEQLGMHPIWIDRMAPEHVVSLLLLSVAVGAMHIMLGLILGVWDAIRNRSRNHLLERGGMLVGLVALFLLVGGLADFLPKGFITPAVGGVIVGIVLLGLPMGWLGILIGPIEFIGLIGNILSYLRLAAIGLASVYLALVANEMAGMIGNVVVGLILATLIHALNLLMGAFSPTIHSLRLHYVEFFRKFYEGGGRPYTPFKSQLGPG